MSMGRHKAIILFICAGLGVLLVAAACQPTPTPKPTNTPVPPTSTIAPTATKVATPTSSLPTQTPGPTNTAVATATSVPATATAVPTATSVPTATPVPTPTRVPATLKWDPTPSDLQNSLTITGANFAANDTVKIVVAGALGGADLTLLPSVKADASGGFKVDFQTSILAPVPSGTYTVRATGATGITASFNWTKQPK